MIGLIDKVYKSHTNGRQQQSWHLLGYFEYNNRRGMASTSTTIWIDLLSIILENHTRRSYVVFTLIIPWNK